MRKLVWIERDPISARPIRIFRSKSAAMGEGRTARLMPYYAAVFAIRHQLWERSGGFCELCAAPITEILSQMHEQKHRGQGGEISLENSVLICGVCHKRAHADRNPRFSKKDLTSE